MPLQNRVDPWGNIVANPARGTLLGNRGILHDENRQIVRTYQHQAWVACRLSFKNRRRQLMSPGSYTELFFLDEATAFAAGHRPCSECRRERYVEFKETWVRANLNVPVNDVKASDINRLLHRDRIIKGVKVTYTSKINELPDGTIVSDNGSACLVFQNRLYQWSFAGYRLQKESNISKEVDVLTPKSIVKTFERGFRPEIHGSIIRSS